MGSKTRQNKVYVDLTLEAQSIKEKNYKLEFIKIENFYSVKEPVKWIKILSTDFKKTFKLHSQQKTSIQNI